MILLFRNINTFHLLSTYSVLQQPPTFLASGTGFVEDSFSTDGLGGDGSGSNVSHGERWGAADEASCTSLLFTSCCVAPFLTDHRLGPVPVRGLGVGDPCCTGISAEHFTYMISLKLRTPAGW